LNERKLTMRLTGLICVALLAVAPACKQKEKKARPVDATATLPVTGPAVATPSPSFDAVAWDCCGNPSASVLLEHYLKMEKALATENAFEARRSAQAMLQFAGAATQDGALSSSSRKLVMRIQALLETVKEGELPALRDAFDDLSNLMVPLLQANRGGNTRIAVAWCARNNANWIQDGAIIANPYLGANDRGCGVFRP